MRILNQRLINTRRPRKTKRNKAREAKRIQTKRTAEEDKKKPTGDDKVTPEKKKKTPEKKTPEKTSRNPSGDENSETPTKSKKKPIWTVQECRKDKWASDSPLAIGYHQCRAISIHNLPEGCNFDDHTDYIRQLMRHESLGVNIKSLDDRIQELEGLTSTHHVGLLAALKEWKGKQMGNSGITPQYVVKAFAELVSQRKIVKCHDDHWHSDLMIGLYSIHQYDAICKENARRADGAKPTALGILSHLQATPQAITPVSTITSGLTTVSCWSAVTTGVSSWRQTVLECTNTVS